MFGILRNFGFKKQRTLPPVSDERMAEEKDFLESARGKLEALELIRERKLVTFSFRKAIAIPAAVVLTPVLAYADYWLLMIQRGDDDSAAGLSFAFIGLLYWWVTQPRREYAKAYKRYILPSLARLFGNFSYNVDGRIPMCEMRPSKIVPHHDKYESEDYFAGEYMGVGIRFSEVDLKQRRRNKNRTYYVSVFKGLAVLLDMKSKRFLGHTILDQNKSRIGEWFKERSFDSEAGESG